MITDPAVEAYARDHTTPPSPALAEVIEHTMGLGAISGMMTGPVEGRFLEFLVFALQPKLVLEIGTFTGYSSISMASVLPAGSRLVTCDVNEKAHATARRFAETAGVADRIEYRLGPAIDTIAALDGPFDLVFIDADKPSYAAYYEAVLPKLSPGGVIAVDNTLWAGRVVERANDSTAEGQDARRQGAPTQSSGPPLAEGRTAGGTAASERGAMDGDERSNVTDENTSAIRAFNDMVRDDDRVVSVLLTVRDGITLIRKR